MMTTMTTQQAAPAPHRAPDRRPPVWLPAVAAGGLVSRSSWAAAHRRPPLPGIPDPGPVTGWGLPLVRLATDLAAVCAVGLALAAGLLLPATSGQLRGERARDAGTVVWAALAIVVLAAVQIPLTLSNVLAEPLGGVTTPTLLSQFVTQTDLGRALVAQMVIAAALAVTAFLVESTAGAVWLLVLALACLVPQSLVGHAASSVAHPRRRQPARARARRLAVDGRPVRARRWRPAVVWAGCATPSPGSPRSPCGASSPSPCRGSSTPASGSARWTPC